MRQETIIKTYGTFEELTKERQLKELDVHRDINVSHDWYADSVSDFKDALNILGFKKVKIEFTGFWSQGDGASFTGEFNLPTDTDTLEMRLDKFKSEYPWLYDSDKKLSDSFLDFDLTDDIYNETLSVYRISHHYSHSNTITCDNNSVKDFARSFSDFIYKRLDKEYEYLTSDEQVKETLISNEMEFLISEMEFLISEKEVGNEH